MGFAGITAHLGERMQRTKKLRRPSTHQIGPAPLSGTDGQDDGLLGPWNQKEHRARIRSRQAIRPGELKPIHDRRSQRVQRRPVSHIGGIDPGAVPEDERVCDRPVRSGKLGQRRSDPKIAAQRLLQQVGQLTGRAGRTRCFGEGPIDLDGKMRGVRRGLGAGRVRDRLRLSIALADRGRRPVTSLRLWDGRPGFRMISDLRRLRRRKPQGHGRIAVLSRRRCVWTTGRRHEPDQQQTMGQHHQRERRHKSAPRRIAGQIDTSPQAPCPRTDAEPRSPCFLESHADAAGLWTSALRPLRGFGCMAEVIRIGNWRHADPPDAVRAR